MSTAWKSGPARVVLALLPIAAVAAVALIVALHVTGGHRAEADFPHAGLDFSIGVGSQCDSSAGPAKCTFATSAMFTLNFKLNTIPGGFTYSGYDSEVGYTAGLTVVGSCPALPCSLVQQGAGAWTDCVFAAPSFGPGNLVAPGCAIGLPPAPSSTYMGVIWHIDFACGASPSQETLTLANGAGHTDLGDEAGAAHGEGVDESLTINCGDVPVPTDTPSGPTNTPGPPTNTPTITPTRTATRTPTVTPTRGPGLLGDVNGDGSVTSIDALFVLQFDAHLITHVPLPEKGDLNHDGMINSIDALFILQIQAGLLPQPM